MIAAIFIILIIGAIILVGTVALSVLIAFARWAHGLPLTVEPKEKNNANS